MKNNIPYGQTFKLQSDLTNVECWNFLISEKFTVPAGLLVRLDNVSSPTETVICIVDETGAAPGIVLEYVPTYHAHIPSTHSRTPVKQTGYRFIVDNQALGAAIGQTLTKKTRDLVGEIIVHETGEATPAQEAKLFRKLKKSGLGKKLQGHYSSRC